MSNGKANVDICSDIVTVRSRENQGLMTETDNLLVLVTCHQGTHVAMPTLVKVKYDHASVCINRQSIDFK